MSNGARILVGEFGRPHGVRGLVRIRSFTAEPADVAAYGPLSDEGGGLRFVLQWLADGLVRVEGIEDRDAAARLTGTRLYVARESLPPPGEEEFYLADLIGLLAETEAGEALGRVAAVEDHGAGAFLTLRDEAGRELLLPFTRVCVPVVDMAGGRVVCVPPGEQVVPPQPGDGSGEPDADEEGASDNGLGPAPNPLPRRPSMTRRTGGRGAL